MTATKHLPSPRRLGVEQTKQLPPTFTAHEARAAGLAPRDLYGMRDHGLLIELSRGVFRKAEAPETAHLDLIAVATRAPRAVICLESALALHGLIDDIPSATHIAVPRDSHPPVIDYPPVKVSRFDGRTFDIGVESFEAAPAEYVRVYGEARSVVDAMRLRHWFGETLALHALGLYVRRSQGRVTDLLRLAQILDVERPVRSAVEAVTA